MKLILLGGFLGAGKTTAARALARHLRERGDRVAIVTNDQGRSLVDTALCAPDADQVTEIGGGCFCCRYSALEDALDQAAGAGASVVIAEAVGSCTDLIATVVAPLAARRPQLRLAPYAVLVDPARVAQMHAGAFDEEVRYLFRKQIEEADVVVLTRADQVPPDVEPAIRAIRPDVSVVRISSTTGQGLAEWLATAPSDAGQPLEIDYDRYAAAEALLGWSNSRAVVQWSEPLPPRRFLERFLERLDDTPIAHLKLVAHDPGGDVAATAVNLVQARGVPVFSGAPLPESGRRLALIINARVAMPPEALEARLDAALRAAAPDATVSWQELETFSPSRPVPEHRLSVRCGPGSDASCCASFYAEPVVRYLLGDSLHPGGDRLTLEVAERLGLQEGSQLLDVACGNGNSLRAIGAQWGVVAVGLDASPPRDGPPSPFEMRAGDVHAIPFASARFDAVLCECALSTFADQGRALAEIHRVLRPGGRLAISDMVVNGPIPPELAQWVQLGTCLSSAMSLPRYAGLLKDAGFRVVETWDAPWALEELLRRIKRQLLGAAVARATGALSDDVAIDIERGRATLRDARAAVADGSISYGVLIAGRPSQQPRLAPL